MGDDARQCMLRKRRQVQSLTQVLAVECVKERTKWCHHRSGDVGTIGRQQYHGSNSCLPGQVMKELEAGVIGCVKIVYKQDHRAVCCEVGEEGRSGLE